MTETIQRIELRLAGDAGQAARCFPVRKHRYSGLGGFVNLGHPPARRNWFAEKRHARFKFVESIAQCRCIDCSTLLSIITHKGVFAFWPTPKKQPIRANF